MGIFQRQAGQLAPIESLGTSALGQHPMPTVPASSPHHLSYISPWRKGRGRWSPGCRRCAPSISTGVHCPAQLWCMALPGGTGGSRRHLQCCSDMPAETGRWGWLSPQGSKGHGRRGQWQAFPGSELPLFPDELLRPSEAAH